MHKYLRGFLKLNSQSCWKTNVFLQELSPLFMDISFPTSGQLFYWQLYWWLKCRNRKQRQISVAHIAVYCSTLIRERSIYKIKLLRQYLMIISFPKFLEFYNLTYLVLSGLPLINETYFKPSYVSCWNMNEEMLFKNQSDHSKLNNPEWRETKRKWEAMINVIYFLENMESFLQGSCFSGKTVYLAMLIQVSPKFKKNCGLCSKVLTQQPKLFLWEKDQN